MRISPPSAPRTLRRPAWHVRRRRVARLSQLLECCQRARTRQHAVEYLQPMLDPSTHPVAVGSRTGSSLLRWTRRVSFRRCASHGCAMQV